MRLQGGQAPASPRQPGTAGAVGTEAALRGQGAQQTQTEGRPPRHGAWLPAPSGGQVMRREGRQEKTPGVWGHVGGVLHAGGDRRWGPPGRRWRGSGP